MTDKDQSQTDAVEDWLSALTGKADSKMKDASMQQAQQIREIILGNQKAAEDEIDDVRIERGRQQLMFRLSRERLLMKRSAMRTLVQQPMAMAASIAILFVSAILVYTNYTPTPTVIGDELIWSVGELDTIRGTVPTLQIMDAQPAKAARALAQRLADAEIPFELRGTPEAQARVLRMQIAGQQIPNELAAELSRLGVRVDEATVAEIEFIGTD